jgi:glucose-6-phosphate isomerase
MMKTASWSDKPLERWQGVELSMRLDVSRMQLAEKDWRGLRPGLAQAFEAMHALESGAIANPDENRRVGHYWLRDPDRAPEPAIRDEIRNTLAAIDNFAGKVHRGEIRPEEAERFTAYLLIGIGGSALGPQLVAHAFGGPDDRLRPHFLDNTDPAGIDDVLRGLGGELASTLTLVVSKSGGTPETRNGMLEVKAAYERMGLRFGRHAVAVTGAGSALDATARDEEFLAVFPMWDWVGGRTSVWSAVGILPAALQGIDVNAFLDGARLMDEHTRVDSVEGNPAALLAAAWHAAGNGRGDRAMVVLPYKDRLALFSRYLQQLVMESLGKEKDLSGRVVHQGIAVYGNKGSTDQHAYVQQLREGRDDFFVTFIEVLRDREGNSMAVGDDATAGDYLLGFLLGTRAALAEAGRRSLTVTLPDVTPRSLGALIALYERAVGFYATLVGINAYHQPGVEAGKKAAARVLELQARALAVLRGAGGEGLTAPELAERLNAPDDAETLFLVLEHAAANPDHGVRAERGESPAATVFRAI